MSTQDQNTASAQQSTTSPSPWAQGLIMFASVMMIMVGFFQLLVGIAAIAEDEVYVTTPNYIAEFDTTAWGWIHLLLALVVILAGAAVLSGKIWGRTVGVVMAALSALANFAFIPYYPFWSIVIIVLNIFVIWALTAHGRDITR